ncbi:GNAT family N-acetyltransferase [bacterium]|nr:GNAT family N-acetyltransferase [bacterium]
MPDIQIYPIFDQTVPGIWADFADIRIQAIHADSKTKWLDGDNDRLVSEFGAAWHHNRFNFAFGAYDGHRMIGFAQGDLSHQVGYIRGLYVRPEYQRQGVGLTLLRAAERALSMNGKYVDLVTRLNARGFYAQYGYGSLVGTEELIKNVTGVARCHVVPIFYATPGLGRTLARISAAYDVRRDTAAINDAHRPIWVYVDADRKIGGFALGHVADQDTIPGGVYGADPRTSVAGRLATALAQVQNFNAGR